MQRRPFGYVASANREKVHKADEAARCYPTAGEVKPPILRREPVLRSGLAAGNLLLPADAGAGALLVAGAVAHGAMSLAWGTVLAVAVRRTSLPPLAVGAVLRRRG
ncbi:MAG TPA: hypothetical protein VJ456_06005 [Acidimicrobiia bacterium]|nr:hypothetical protein [Acidimicrobiia bacterium]